MITITRRFEIDAGHRLQKHESKCRNVHGHRYAFEITLAIPELDGLGRVVDFGVVKEFLGTWLDAEIDHGFIAEEGDPLIEILRAMGSKVYVTSKPPTIETLVHVVGLAARGLLPRELRVVSVVGYETPSCRAEWRPS